MRLKQESLFLYYPHAETLPTTGVLLFWKMLAVVDPNIAIIMESSQPTLVGY